MMGSDTVYLYIIVVPELAIGNVATLPRSALSLTVERDESLTVAGYTVDLEFSVVTAALPRPVLVDTALFTSPVIILTFVYI